MPWSSRAARIPFQRSATKADIRFYQLNTVAPPNPTGSFAFTTTGTNTQTTTATTTTGGNPLASFLLGQVDTFSIDLQTSKLRPRDHIQEYFVQDDWHALPGLTLNIGARWKQHSPSTEKNNQGAVFNLATQQLDYVGVNGNSRSARTLHYDNVAPRFGLTYLLTPKTVVRSGFGIVFIDQSGITTPFTVPQFYPSSRTCSRPRPTALRRRSSSPTAPPCSPSRLRLTRVSASRYIPQTAARAQAMSSSGTSASSAASPTIFRSMSPMPARTSCMSVFPTRTSTSSPSSSSQRVAHRCKPRLPTPTPASFPERWARRPSAMRSS